MQLLRLEVNEESIKDKIETESEWKNQECRYAWSVKQKNEGAEGITRVSGGHFQHGSVLLFAIKAVITHGYYMYSLPANSSCAAIPSCLNRKLLSIVFEVSSTEENGGRPCPSYIEIREFLLLKVIILVPIRSIVNF